MKHVPLVQKRHPMLPPQPDGKDVDTVCAQCGELWPCTVTELLEALKRSQLRLLLLAGVEPKEKSREEIVVWADECGAAVNKAEGR